MNLLQNLYLNPYVGIPYKGTELPTYHSSVKKGEDMKKVIVFYEDVNNPRRQVFQCYVANDFHLEKMKTWLNAWSGSKPYPKYTFSELS